MQASLIGSLLRTKKGMAHKGFHSILRVAIHKSVLVPDSFTQPAETKKVPKDCHVYTWYPLTLLTILNSVCPRSPRKEPEPAGCCVVCGHIGYVLPVPVPRLQVSHKNQLRVYINTISCMLSTSLYYISHIHFPCLSHTGKIFYFFQKFFKYLHPFRILTFQIGFLLWLIRSLKTEEHTPSCIWVLVDGSLLMVCPPSGLNCT